MSLPDHWNDPGTLTVGNGMAVNRDRVHYPIMCLLAAPHVAGNDLSKMCKGAIAILTNKGTTAISQYSPGNLPRKKS